MYIPLFLYLSHQWTFGLLPPLGYVNNVSTNMGYATTSPRSSFKFFFKNIYLLIPALAGVAQWIEHQTVKQRVPIQLLPIQLPNLQPRHMP